MNTFIIYEGPNSTFEEFLSTIKEQVDSEYSLSQLVKIYNDTVNFEKTIQENYPEGPPLLVIRAEEFYSIKDHFIENLFRLMKNFLVNGIFEIIVIQNPPKSLKTKLASLDNDRDFDIVYERYDREKITKEKMSDFIVEFDDKIKGQELVLSKVIASLYTVLNKPKHLPLVLMFYGPPGVGKTETAKLLNNVINEGPILRQQLSMYKTNAFYNYIFGGEEDTNSLAKDLSRYKGNVILFDEFNQCPREVYSAFLQMFDEGILEDNRYEIDLTNTIIICTSNFSNKQEIYNALGAALYSRFTEFIEFIALDDSVKEQLITEQYEKTLSNLSLEDQTCIRNTTVYIELISHVKQFSNARNIKKGVELYISKVLADKFIQEITLDNKRE